MNKNLYRIIFSQTQQCLIVVSELARRAGKAVSDAIGLSAQKVRSILTALCGAITFKPLSFALFCALGFVSLANPTQAETLIIQADPSAAANQRPTVLHAANGVPQVNIQTPNDKGLSYNRYQQFDVDTKGAILNNSGKNTQTQLGGWVQGNPYLASGEAKVIVNEVNSQRPSQLRGYVEVAGKKADVIIANPNGLHCEGCGVINAERTVFTTGKPELKDGNLEGFVVERGNVSVSGKGMDNSQSDYTDIITRNAQINAGIWSKKELNVTSGQNRVSKNNDSVQIITNSTEKRAENAPHFAVDVSALGGMYAEKIRLIGTEDGLGVRNAGHIGAAAGNVHIDSAGKIVNSGLINASAQIAQQAKQDIENKGRIESKSANINLESGKHIRQDGVVVTRGGNIKLRATETITQQGESVARGNIDVEAKQVSASSSSLIAAGVETVGDGKTERRHPDAQNAQGKNLTVHSQQSTTLNGKNLASGNIAIHATTINLDQSQSSANTLEAQASQGGLSANNARLTAQENLTLTTPSELSTQNAQLRAKQIQTRQARLNNQQGRWEQTGTTDFFLNAQSINNFGGRIGTQGSFNLQTGKLENENGTLIAGNGFKLNVGQSALNSQNGIISAKGDLSILSGALNNNKGLIQAANLKLNTQGQAFTNTNTSNAGVISLGNVSLQTGVLDNQQGRIAALGEGKTTATDLNNQAGIIQTQGDHQISASHIHNQALGTQGSLIESGASLNIHALTLDNQATATQKGTPTQGIIADKFTLNGQALNNRQGGIYTFAQTALNLADSLNNAQGEILGTGNIQVQGETLIIDNQQGTLQSKGELDINAQSLSGDGHLEAGQIALQLKQDFHNLEAINAQHRLSIKTQGDIYNQNRMSANEGITLQAQNLNNLKEGKISSGETRITTTQAMTNRGLINSFNDTDNAKTVIKAQRLENIGSGRIYGDWVALQGEQLTNRDESVEGKAISATIAARKQLVLSGKTIENNTALYEANQKASATIFSDGDIIFGARLNANDEAEGQADSLKNSSSIIEATGNIVLNVLQTQNSNAHFSTEMQEKSEEGGKIDQEYMLMNFDRGSNINYGAKIKMDRLRRVKPDSKKVHDTYDLDWNYDLDRKLDADELNAGYVPPGNKSVCLQADPSLCYIKPTTIYDSRDPIWKHFEIDIGKDSPLLANIPNLSKEPSKPIASHRILRNPSRRAKYEAELVIYEEKIKAYKAEVVAYNNALKPYLDWAKKNKDSFARLNQAIETQNSHNRGRYNGYWRLEQKELKVIKETVATSLPGQILAGGNISTNGNEVINDKSTLIAGAQLQIDAKHLHNLDHKGIREDHLLGNSQFMYHRWRGNKKGRRWYNSDLYTNQDRVEKHSFDMNVYSALSDTPHNQITKVGAVDNGVIASPLKTFENQTALARQQAIEVRSLQADIRLPNQSLYRLNPAADSHVLIETDPQFADRKTWLSSDYMYNALRANHDNVLKRLGDGYYEQRLVRDQINRLTGRQFIGSHLDFQTQYKALMDAGITFAQKFHLAPGITLSAEQVANLTDNMVWLETQAVTLPDGSVQNVLVPKVYVLAHQGEIDGTGTLLSATQQPTATTKSKRFKNRAIYPSQIADY